jgi:hypothetical protein
MNVKVGDMVKCGPFDDSLLGIVLEVGDDAYTIHYFVDSEPISGVRPASVAYLREYFLRYAMGNGIVV